MIKLSNVSRKYKDEYALKDCTISLPDLGFIAIVGESGSGKTTLLNILGMLEKEYDGQIFFDGNEFTSDGERSEYRLKNISYIFQDSLLLPYLSVGDNLALQNELAGRILSEDELMQTAKQLNVAEFLKRKINELSAGQKQRLAILRALITGSKIILADEPTGNLDEDSARNVFECLKQASLQSLIVVVTHDELLATKYADRVIRLDNGNVVADSGDVLDKKLTVEDRNNNVRKPRQPFYKIIRGDIKNKPKMVRKMVSGMALSLLTVSLFVTLGISVFQTGRSTELFIMETDLIEASETFGETSDILRNSCFLLDVMASDYSFLKEDARFEEITYMYATSGAAFNGDKQTNLSHIDVIDNNAFYKKRWKF